MNYYIYFTIFILGLILGSFLNVVIYRLKNGGTIVSGRSKCPKCKKKLSFLDLIPVFSFIFLKGKCKYCKKKISWQYPLVELASAFLAVFVFVNLGIVKNNFEVFSSFNEYFLFGILIYLFLSLLVIFVYDLLHYLIPDVVLLPALLFSVFIFLGTYFTGVNFSLIQHVLGMIIFSGFFAIQYFISKGRWVGGGDIKLGLFLGLILGWQLTLVSLFLAYVVGALVALVLMATKKKTRKDILPFGPFLIAASFISFFYGQAILDWYLRILLN